MNALERRAKILISTETRITTKDIMRFADEIYKRSAKVDEETYHQLEVVANTLWSIMTDKLGVEP